MRPIVHAPDCKHATLRCTCGATFRELMRRHEEWKKDREAKQCAQSPQS